MRLAAQAKMGYYPTPPNVTRIICNHLQRKTEGTIRVFDPCAGEGTALKDHRGPSRRRDLRDRAGQGKGATSPTTPYQMSHCRLPDFGRIEAGLFAALPQPAL